MKIEWNKVTRYSKLAAVVLFVGVAVGAFWFGRWYEKIIQVNLGREIKIAQKNNIVPNLASRSSEHIYAVFTNQTGGYDENVTWHGTRIYKVVELDPQANIIKELATMTSPEEGLMSMGVIPMTQEVLYVSGNAIFAKGFTKERIVIDGEKIFGKDSEISSFVQSPDGQEILVNIYGKGKPFASSSYVYLKKLLSNEPAQLIYKYLLTKDNSQDFNQLSGPEVYASFWDVADKIELTTEYLATECGERTSKWINRQGSEIKEPPFQDLSVYNHLYSLNRRYTLMNKVHPQKPFAESPDLSCGPSDIDGIVSVYDAQTRQEKVIENDPLKDFKIFGISANGNYIIYKTRNLSKWPKRPKNLDEAKPEDVIDEGFTLANTATMEKKHFSNQKELSTYLGVTNLGEIVPMREDDQNSGKIFINAKDLYQTQLFEVIEN